MGMPVNQLAQVMVQTLIWAQNKAGSSALIKEVEVDGNEMIGTVIPGDQRVRITIHVEDITEEGDDA